MSKIYFEVEDDVVIKYTPMPEIEESTYKTEVVMTKEIFQECYKKWVDPQERSERMEIKEFCKKIDAVPMSVIEDIKTEIKELPYQRIFGNVSSYSLLDTVLEIIDKHIERSE